MRAAIHIVIMMMTNSLIVSFVCPIKVPTRVTWGGGVLRTSISVGKEESMFLSHLTFI